MALHGCDFSWPGVVDIFMESNFNSVLLIAVGFVFAKLNLLGCVPID